MIYIYGRFWISNVWVLHGGDHEEGAEVPRRRAGGTASREVSVAGPSTLWGYYFRYLLGQIRASHTHKHTHTNTHTHTHAHTHAHTRSHTHTRTDIHTRFRRARAFFVTSV